MLLHLPQKEDFPSYWTKCANGAWSLARTTKDGYRTVQSNTCATPVLTQEGHAGQQACTVPTACRRMVPCTSGTWATTRTARPPTPARPWRLCSNQALIDGATGRPVRLHEGKDGVRHGQLSRVETGARAGRQRREQPSLRQFCRALAKRYPADADIAKLQYCRGHPMDETAIA